MKRDLETIRAILLAVEAKPTAAPARIDVPGVGPDVLEYHLELLVEAGYVKGYRMMTVTLPMALTWSGHEFLDATRNDTVWQKVKTTLHDRGVDAPLTVIQQLATQIGARLLGL